MELHSLTHRSPPAVRPGSYQATDWYWSVAWGLGTPVVTVHQGVRQAQGKSSVHSSAPGATPSRLPLRRRMLCPSELHAVARSCPCGRRHCRVGLPGCAHVGWDLTWRRTGQPVPYAVQTRSSSPGREKQSPWGRPANMLAITWAGSVSLPGRKGPG